MAVSPEVFRTHLLDSHLVLEPFNSHHELSGGLHGQKLDFDNIPSDSNLYQEWVDITVEHIEQTFPSPEAIVGVANGTNRLALDVARRYDGKVWGLISEKPADRREPLRLTAENEKFLYLMRLDRVVVLEDVGTTGGNAAMVARQVRDFGPQVGVLVTWKRREFLEKLHLAHIRYASIIDSALQTYTPEQCRNEGFCAQGMDFIPKDR